MVQVITFPDVEAIAIDWLNDNMTEPAHSTVPNPRPDNFVLVFRTGGPKRNLVTDQPQITVESWGTTKSEAHDTAQEARAWLNALQGQVRDGVQVYRVEEAAGPGWLPDPVSEKPRYTQSFTVALRGAVSGS